MYKVMIVDNEKNIQTGLKVGIQWEDLDCEITGLANDGSEALELIRKNPPDIVITDVRMEPMDGLTLCKEVETFHPEIKFILITGFQDFDVAVAAANQHNILKVLLKPTSVYRISEAVGEVISVISKDKRHRMLEEQSKSADAETIHLQQSIILSQILNTESMKASEAKKLVSRIGFTIKQYKIIFIRFLEMADEQPPSSEAVIRYIDQIFKPFNYTHLAIGDSYQYVLFISDPKSAAGFSESLLNCCKDFANIIDCCSEYSCYIGISKLFDNIAEIRTAYRQANETVHYTALHMDLPVLEYRNLPDISDINIDKCQGYLDQIIKSITALDLGQALQDFDQLYLAAMEIRLPSRNFKTFCILITNACFENMLHFQALTNLVIEEQSRCYRVIAEQSTTLTQAYHFCAEILKKYLKSPRPTSETSLVSQIEQYIANNYQSDLTLDTIAEAFYISPSYLSRLYKKEKGISPISHLRSVRMEQAIELARKTDLRAYEIGASVGINDPVYFSKLFKKALGMSISEYRQKMRSDLSDR